MTRVILIRLSFLKNNHKFLKIIEIEKINMNISLKVAKISLLLDAKLKKKKFTIKNIKEMFIKDLKMYE